MRVFQDLRLAGRDDQTVNRLINGMRRRLNGNWAEDVARAEAITTDVGRRVFCFLYRPNGADPIAQVWLHHDAPGTLSVSNIIPAGSGRRLGVDQYNRVLGSFYTELAEPATIESRAQAELSPADVSIIDLAGASTADALLAFSRHANKSLGGSHPDDRRRWMEFLVAAHRERSSLGRIVLRTWLIEEEGWPDEYAHDLAGEFERSLELLSLYDQTA